MLTPEGWTRHTESTFSAPVPADITEYTPSADPNAPCSAQPAAELSQSLG
jgi:hypothetical protein